jgi:hypothetical protein
MLGAMQHHRPSPALKAAALMPLLPHNRSGEPFDITKSEVVHYLIAQPEIQQSVFNFCKRAGAINFDLDTGKWVGASYSASNELPATSSHLKHHAHS